jgi:hypothetical protein
MGFVCRDEPEKVLSFKAKKKVTFDPNVKIYEYVSCNEVSDFYLENEGSGKKGEEKNTAKSSNSKSFSAQIHLRLSYCSPSQPTSGQFWGLSAHTHPLWIGFASVLGLIMKKICFGFLYVT